MSVSTGPPFDAPSATGRNATFGPNRTRAVHRWYPYLEGFSADFVLALLGEFGDGAEVVHDPFAGTGTTVVVASGQGRRATYCEINPFLRLLVDAKVHCAPRVAAGPIDADRVERVARLARDRMPSLSEAERELAAAFGTREYLTGRRLREVVSLRRAIDRVEMMPELRSLLCVALASIVVECSQLRRVGDVRYRYPAEMAQRIVSPVAAFVEKARDMLRDIASEDYASRGRVALAATSALAPPDVRGDTDLVITSPPYLNGTNYFRNTKLELWVTGLLGHERELGDLRAQAVAAGINNVSKRGRTPTVLPYVEHVAMQLDVVAYDPRIPELVRRYFSDARTWLANLHLRLRPGGCAVIDIGGSRFAGVSVRTDVLLGRVAEDVGFGLMENRVLRRRRSRDGGTLEQNLLVLRRREPA